jgi:hypothetical protein
MFRASATQHARPMQEIVNQRVDGNHTRAGHNPTLPQRICAKWLYGASLQREAWGGYSYKYERLRCLKWVDLDIPQPVRLFPFLGFGTNPADQTPWVTLNPQPLPPKARRPR